MKINLLLPMTIRNAQESRFHLPNIMNQTKNQLLLNQIFHPNQTTNNIRIKFHNYGKSVNELSVHINMRKSNDFHDAHFDQFAQIALYLIHHEEEQFVRQ